MSDPIELYFWPTPNGWKISIALEEMELPYVMKPVAIGRGDQFKPDFMAISPNNRMPVLVDHARTLSPLEIRHGWRFESFEQHADHVLAQIGLGVHPGRVGQVQGHPPQAFAHQPAQ